MSDLVDRIRSELDDRAAQLKPAADEFARLRLAVDALDRLTTPTAPRAAASARADRPPARATPARRRRAAGSGDRAAPGQTQRRVIEQLRSGPGSTSTAVAHALGISANAAAATISRLVKQGRVRRLETGGYAAADPPPPGSPDAGSAGLPHDPRRDRS